MKEIALEGIGSNGRTDGYRAESQPETAEFLRELWELCRKHGLALVPTAEFEVSFHDQMRVVPYSEEIWAEMRGSFVVFKQ